MPKIVAVVPSIRPLQMESFRAAWAPLFEKHQVTLVTVWDGDILRIDVDRKENLFGSASLSGKTVDLVQHVGDLFCRHTDACRNIGLAFAATTDADFILTLDDDVVPMVYDDGARYNLDRNTWEGGPHDPIEAHLETLARRVPISWMNTAHDTDLYLRGFPYGIRDEAPVMLSHGVWVGTPDFDGETQLRLEQTTGIPHSLPYYVGPIPKGALFPLCGMNVMIRREALPYFYFAPMGPDSGQPNLHRFADIYMGWFLKQKFDELGWACYTGASTILHTRASDAKKNMEQEKLGRGWLEGVYSEWTTEIEQYFAEYGSKRQSYAKLIEGILEGKS